MKTKPLSRRRFLGGSAGLALAATGLARAGEDQTSNTGDHPAADTVWQDNPVIQRARAAALEVLQPTPKQLDHGLQLHADSLVFDGYGFAPRAAIDGDALRLAVEAGASDIEIQDLREDMQMTRPAVDDVERAEFVQAFAAAGVNCIFQNAGEEGQDPLRLIKRLARFTYLTDMIPEVVARAATPAAIEKIAQANGHCLYLTGNGVPITQQWVSVEDELRYVRVFFELGIRMMHVTYNRRNMLGDGCAEPANGGLSDFGRAAVAEMNRVGVIVDVAHCGWQTSLDAAKASARPMVASHTTCTALNKHIRSKPDEVIRAIVDSGGYVGICSIPAFLGGKCDIAAMLDHIDHVAKRFGVDHVAIGTDKAYSSRNAGAENRKVPRSAKRRKNWAGLWPEGSLAAPSTASPNAELTLAWTNWPLLTVGLVQRGYTDAEIQKIIGGNVMRVARDVLGGDGDL